MTTENASTHTNIDQFNFAALAIFKWLYRAFPIQREIFNPGDFCKRVMPPQSFPLDFSVVGHQTFLWLRGAGFVSATPVGTGNFKDVVLTLKCYALLDSNFEQDGHYDPEPMIRQINRAIPDVPTQVHFAELHRLMGEFVRRMAFAESAK